MPDYTSLDINTSDYVYMPSEDTELAAGLLNEYLASSDSRDISVLDMGTGTGAIGITAAMNDKVSTVVLADKDGNALALAKKNVLSNIHKLRAKCDFVATDLFSGIDKSKKFDMITFNPPYLPAYGEKSPLEGTWNGGRTGTEVTTAFLEDAVKYLTDKGAVLIVMSSFADEKIIHAHAGRLGLVECMRKTRHIFFEDIDAVVFAKE